MDEFSCTILRLHPDIIALTEVKQKNPASPIQLSELNIYIYIYIIIYYIYILYYIYIYNVFTNIVQVATGGHVFT